MTILGAMDGGDYLTIASDSMAFTGPNGVTFNMVKLAPIKGLSVVWGFFGAGTVGGDLRAWIDATDLSDSTSWPSLKDRLSEQMARLTGDLRRRTTEAGGGDVPANQLTSALFVGYVSGEKGIVTMTPEGAATFVPVPFAFIAADSVFAAACAAMETLHRERGDRFAFSAEVLRISISVATDLMMTTGGPIQLWKMTPTGAEQIT
jgi:hypothetical protein